MERYLKQIEKQYDQILDEFRRLNREAINRLRGYFLRHLAQLELDEKGVRIAKTEENEERIAAMKRNFETELKKSGFYRDWERFVRRYEDLKEYQHELWERLGKPEARRIQDIFVLDVLRRQTLEEIGGASRLVNREIRELFDNCFYGDGTFTELVRGLEGKLGKLEHYSYTIANTGLQVADAAINKHIAQTLGVKRFRYWGALDKKTRPFCKAILSGRHPNTGKPHPNNWTIEEIQNLDNKQIPDAFLHRGGYNCRHRWLPIIS